MKKINLRYKVTFFPSHWSHEQVIDAIHQAYDDFLLTNAYPEFKNCHILKTFFCSVKEKRIDHQL